MSSMPKKTPQKKPAAMKIKPIKADKVSVMKVSTPKAISSKAKTSPIKSMKAEKKAAPKTIAKKGAKMQPVKISAESRTIISTFKKFRLGTHMLIAGSAIAVLMLLATIERNTFATRGTNAEDVIPVSIGLEHTSPLSLSVLVARKEQAGYVSITNQSSETVYISVPSDWSRTEVTGARIQDVTSAIPVFGFTRWTIPGNAGIKMLVPTSPDVILFDSTSSAVTAVDLKAVDLTNSTTNSKVVLVQKQALVNLWENQ